MMAYLTLSGAAWAAPPAPPPSTDSAGATGNQAPPPADESLIEFLGSDDVGDAGVWEYLTRKSPPPTPPARKAGAQDEGQ